MGFHPADAPLLVAQTDQLIDIATHITELVNFTGRDKEPAAKAAKRAELAKDGLARKLFILNKMISPEVDCILGDKIGLADTAIWRMCGWLSAELDGIPTEILSAFPHISRVCKAVYQHPKIMW